VIRTKDARLRLNEGRTEKGKEKSKQPIEKKGRNAFLSNQ
jgi:hypothetical protein